MQRHKLATTALAYASLSLAAAVVPASASTSPSAVSQPRDYVVVVDCFSKPQVRPSEFLIACGDGNSGLTEVEWTHWGSKFAVGRGLNFVNDCRPYCAAGTFHSYPVNITLARPEPWEEDPDQERYTRMRLVYTDGTPAQTPRDVTHRLWG
ncbi:hypothetical protein [Streptomyces sp. NPDC000410]|uniref:hypothetical protein n=1 Tax=Streptomyces sp. NPDC000410 TaxID=3154254 RepID=UPI00332C7A23